MSNLLGLNYIANWKPQFRELPEEYVDCCESILEKTLCDQWEKNPVSVFLYEHDRRENHQSPISYTQIEYNKGKNLKIWNQSKIQNRRSKSRRERE
jgi:hypothetical protein